ncbi:GNAT family N-acetyltransferase [Streptomyces sp. NPDC056527]|uniref:GNAT family N-acetyltransferase n=1 Tax=Streptomyces sp. NPDC056527 TaxID=3345853 RepID=UPI0036C9BD92
MTDYTLSRYGRDDLPTIRQTLLDVHADAYGEQMHDPFHQRFPWFVDTWGSLSTFDCVIAYDGDEPAGFAYGASANPGREWWREHLSPAPNPDTTFALSELMVRPKWRKTGLSKSLHDHLLRSRPETLTVLLVDTAQPRVQALYEAWGYHKVGERQPFPDSPRCAVMLHGLPEA